MLLYSSLHCPFRYKMSSIHWSNCKCWHLFKQSYETCLGSVVWLEKNRYCRRDLLLIREIQIFWLGFSCILYFSHVFCSLGIYQHHMNGRTQTKPTPPRQPMKKHTIARPTNQNRNQWQHCLTANQSEEANKRRSSVSCSCFASFPLFFSSRLPGTDLQNNRTQAEFGLICSGEKTRRLFLESLLSQKLGSHFSQIGAVFRRHRAKRCSRSQASNPGRRGGRRSLGIGMEIGEGAGGPGGPDGPGIRFGCASFNQDST